MLKELLFGKKDKIKVLEQEAQLLEKIPEEQKYDHLVNLRFKAWLAYNKLKPNSVMKYKMQQAFAAGFSMRNLKE